MIPGTTIELPYEPPPPVTERHAVIISRQWGSPSISIDVTIAGIKLGVSLDYFVDRLLHEIGSPLRLLTAAQLDARVRTAVEAVVLGVKRESVRAP